MRQLTAKYHAALAVAAVLAVLIIVISALLVGLSLVDARRTELEARSLQLELLKRRANRPAATAAVQGAAIGEPFFGDGAFPLAANELQQRVLGLIEKAGGTLVTVGIDPPVTADDDTGRRVAVQAVAKLSNDGLQKVLYHLEAERPFVFVESLLVSRPTAEASSSSDGGPASLPLAVDLRAAGYFRRVVP